MNNTSTLTPLPLENVDHGGDPKTWLAAQDEMVRRVTFVCDHCGLAQRPVIDPTAYVDPAARLMGGVILGPRCYVGPFAVVRLDEKPDAAPLVVGADSNLQDGAIVHSTTGNIGSRVIVAHQAIVHGAEVEDDVTLYIQAVADGGGTVLGAGSFLHQGTYVGKGIRLAPGRYVAPGQKVLTQAEADALPDVPAELKSLRDHVLELNLSHVPRHCAAAGI